MIMHGQIQKGQYHALFNLDPYALESFLEICDTFKANNASKDVIHLRLFPFFV